MGPADRRSGQTGRFGMPESNRDPPGLTIRLWHRAVRAAPARPVPGSFRLTRPDRLATVGRKSVNSPRLCLKPQPMI